MRKETLFVSLLGFSLILFSGCTQPPTGQFALAETQCRTETFTETVCQDIPFQEEKCLYFPEGKVLCKPEKLEYELSTDNQTAKPVCTKYAHSGPKTGCVEYKFYCSAVIKNLDEKGSRWEFKGQVYKADEFETDEPANQVDIRELNTGFSAFEETIKQYVSPGEGQVVVFTFETNIEDLPDVEKMWCELNLASEATKTVCDPATEPTEECQTVTSYREQCSDVERTRQVCE